MSQFFLISTPIIETWDFNKKNTLMLGNWCNTYDRKNEIKLLNNNIILDYHWENIDKVKKDYLYLNKFGEKILLALSKNLNRIHNENRSEIYWKIILSNWLYTLIHVIYDRWETTQKAFNHFDISSTKIIKIKIDDIIPQSIENFTELLHQDKWNHYIFSKILKNNYSNSIKFEEVTNLNDDKYVRYNKDRSSLLKNLLFGIYKLSRKICYKIFKDDKYFISDSYIGKYNEILLNLKLKNFPISISPRSYLFVKPNHNLRQDISLQVETKNKFEIFCLNMIKELIPCSFLENYKKVNDLLEQSYWPKNPKVIFTSHAINTKTISSFYIAKKKEEGSILIHGQHGGGYGQCKFHWYEKFEKEISDYYLSWGWSDNKKTIPFGMLKSLEALKKVKRVKKIRNKFLIVIRPKERYFSTALDSKIRGPQILDYHLDCIEMAKKLKNVINEKNFIIRLHERTYGWCEKEMWMNNIPNIKIDHGTQPIYENISRSKLVVYTYNSTGYLELMSANLPVLLYWSNLNNPVNNEAENYFKELKDAKIFHENQDSLIEHVNKEWGDIDSWWFSEKVQNIRKRFCKKYAKSNKNKIDDLIRLIKQYELKYE